MNRPASKTPVCFGLAVVAVGSMLAAGPGCRRWSQADSSSSPESTTEMRDSRTRSAGPEAGVAQSTPPSQSTPPNDLRAMVRRVRQFTEEETRGFRKLRITHGLAPMGRVELAIQPAAAVVESLQKLLIANRVCAVLADEMGRVDDLSVYVRKPDVGPGAPSLAVDIGNNFETETFFDCIYVQIRLQLADGHNPVEYRDSFASEGLVRVVSPSHTSESVYVTAEKPDSNLVLDFSVKPDEWFLLPVGHYRRITVRSKAGVWQPALTVGLQNLWDLSVPNATPCRELFGEPAPEVRVVRAPAPHDPGSTENGSPQLVILSPADRATVPRRSAVRGSAWGLEGASVEVLVMPLGDIDYPQDTRGLVRDGRWKVASCLFGRAGRDSGQQFCVRARARGPGGTVVQSATVTVTRE